MKSEFEKKDVEENAIREKDARSKPDCKNRKLRNSVVRRLIHGWPFTSEKYNTRIHEDRTSAVEVKVTESFVVTKSKKYLKDNR